MSPPKTQLRLLTDIISDAVDKIDSKCRKAGVPFPALDDPFNPTNPNEAIMFDPEVLQNAMVIVAATDQLSATVRLPGLSVLDLSFGFHISSSIQAILKGSVAEILREGGPKGVHARDIAAKNGMEQNKLSRLLRLLATHHVFREIEPDVWTNNRLSAFLDTMKPTSELLAHPKQRHIGTAGFAALIDHATLDGLKSSPFLTDVLTNPKTAHGDDPTESAWNHANNIKMTWFEWIETPGNEEIADRFNIAMEGVKKLDDPQAMLRGFPWDSLPQGSKIVDVGGGVGSASLTIAKEFPTYKFVIQDLPALGKQCEALWEEHLPGAHKSGRVTFQGHDFFTPQTEKNANVYLLRMITHDWPTTFVVKILKHLRAAAQAGRTKLLIVDQIPPYACVDTNHAKHVQGAALPPVPPPLLPNLGKASSISYLGDLQMMTFHQGQERTLGEHIRAARESGWNVTHVYTPPGSVFRHIVAETV